MNARRIECSHRWLELRLARLCAPSVSRMRRDISVGPEISNRRNRRRRDTRLAMARRPRDNIHNKDPRSTTSWLGNARTWA